jgi:hypothetical protein
MVNLFQYLSLELGFVIEWNIESWGIRSAQPALDPENEFRMRVLEEGAYLRPR